MIFFLKNICAIISNYCDLHERIKGAARALYPVHVERAQYGKSLSA